MNLKFLFSRFLIPRIRGIVYFYLNKNGSGRKLVLFKPLIFSYSSIRWGANVLIMSNARIEGITNYCGVKFHPKIIIHDRVSIQQNIHLTCGELIVIGQNTAIAANVTITDINHPYVDVDTPIEEQIIETNPVIIGKDSKIYNNAVILPGTILGNHCVVGANSVVSGTIPDYSIVIGTPARIIKRYNFFTQKWEKTNPDGSFLE